MSSLIPCQYFVRGYLSRFLLIYLSSLSRTYNFEVLSFFNCLNFMKISIYDNFYVSARRKAFNLANFIVDDFNFSLQLVYLILFYLFVIFYLFSLVKIAYFPH